MVFWKEYLAVVALALFTLPNLQEKPVAVTDSSVASTGVVMPSVGCPAFDENAFATKVEVLFDNGTVRCSDLPQGVTFSATGDSVVINSMLPGVEFVLSGSSQGSSVTIISERSPLVTLDGLSLVAVGENALQVSSRGLIYIRAKGVSSVMDQPGAVAADKQAATMKFMGRVMFVGNGELSVLAGRRNALLATDTMYVAGGNIAVAGAKGNAVLANKGICLYGGKIVAVADKDVVKSQGDMFLYGGELVLSSAVAKTDAVQVRNFYSKAGRLCVDVAGDAADGIKAKGNIVVAGGAIDVQTSGNALFSEKKFDYSSAACIKCDSALCVTGGSLVLVSKGDGAKGISVDGRLFVGGGDIKVKTYGGDVNHAVDLNAHTSSKGIKSDGSINLQGGNIEVFVLGEGSRSEGVEAKGDFVIGGSTNLYVYAYDDAINAGSSFVLNGGTAFVYSVTNDAVDSNGRVEINGGVLVAEGAQIPEQGLDTDNPGDFVMRGGTLVTAGGSMGPTPTLPLGNATEACVVAWTGMELEKGTYVNLIGKDGKALLSYRLAYGMKDASLVMASPEQGKGKEFTLAVSKEIKGGESVGHGLFRGAVPKSVLSSFGYEQKGVISVVAGDGVEFIDPDTVTVTAMMPPPGFDGSMPPGFAGGSFPPPPPGFKGSFPPQFAGGSFPPPPPGGMGGAFPPPFARDSVRVNSYGNGVYPNY